MNNKNNSDTNRTGTNNSGTTRTGMISLLTIIVAILSLASCSADDSEQYCEVVDRRATVGNYAWETLAVAPTTSEPMKMRWYADGYVYEREVRCFNVFE